MALVWEGGWVIGYSSDASMGFAGGQAEVVDTLWAMRGWRAAPTRREKYPGVLGWWYHPAAIAEETQALLALFFLYSLT